ncbi:MAG: flagellar basal body P-ring protein FlgI [Pirellulales bacterium]
MNASPQDGHNRVSRRKFLWGATALFAGCTAPALRTQSPEILEEELDRVKLVRHFSVPFGVHPLKIESAGLVLGLPGTGGDPPPGTERAMILEEMKKRSVENPNQLLADSSTAVVLVSGYLPPGCQKGDRFDVDVWVPPTSETASLRGGRLLETRLRELTQQRGRIHEGHLMGKAGGPILVDPMAESDDSATLLRRGRILGGGICLKARPLGLALTPGSKSVPASSQIGKVINQRFSTYIKGRKVGVATPKTDGYVELIVHPRYKDNVGRYLQVLRAIAIQETPTQRLERMKVLADQLHDPITAAAAALGLEAIGKEGIETLKTGIQTDDTEIRFYACEALAYLDETSAAVPLGHIALAEPAFRAAAMAALSAMDDPLARDELVQLLDNNSAETRYGAFRALTMMNDRDPLVRGERLNDFTYHIITTTNEPLVHVTRGYRPEVVQFGERVWLSTPLTLEPSHNLLITSASEGNLKLIKFLAGQENEERFVSSKLDDVVRGITDLGFGYPEVVNMLAQARQAKALNCRLEFDALPDASRRYERPPAEES